jgi:excisionase family DNA binding protein
MLPPSPPDGLLTIRELSGRIRLSVPQIRRLVREGRIRSYQPGGRGGKLLFPPDVLEVAIAPLVKRTDDRHASEPQRLPGRRPKFLD